MSTSRDAARQPSSPDGLTVGLPLKVLGLATGYAAALSYLERRLPIKPDHIWAEVAGGVLISLIPVALSARRDPQLDWRRYEGAIWRSFIASGTPIILWQITEAMMRQIELLSYTAGREQKNAEVYAHDTPALAAGGGDRA